MKSDTRLLTGTLCIALVLVCAVIFAGCTSSTAPASPSPPASTSAPAYKAPSVTTGSQPAFITTTLSHGVTISYPGDWQKQVTSETSMRDYGRITTNIANFYSPDISPERALPLYQNVDTAKYTLLSVDVDPNPVDNFENYFNRVTLALQEEYGHIEITKHNYQLKISPTDTFPGYSSYQMDFETDNMEATYIFTNADGTIYIFAFKNPAPYAAEVLDMYKSISIVPPVSAAAQKSR